LELSVKGPGDQRSWAGAAKAASGLLPTTALALRALAPPKSVLVAEATARGWEERRPRRGAPRAELV
ncbi:MAG: hypothetical protein ACM3ZE_14840, partial [Myxococcales bacterium]